MGGLPLEAGLLGNQDLFGIMGGGKPLEPDMLGEFYVLNLIEHNSFPKEDFIYGCLKISLENGMIFFMRIYQDFPDWFDKLSLFELKRQDENEVIGIGIVNILLFRAITLGQVDRPEDAISAYDALILRFADHASPAVQEWVARAMMNRDKILEQLEIDNPSP